MPEPLGPVDPTLFAGVAAGSIALGLALAARRPEWVVAQARGVLALLAVLTLAALAVLVRPEPLGLRLAIDPSTEPLLPAGDPGIGTYRDAVSAFGDDQVYVVAMECADDLFTPENLTALKRIGDAISRLDGVRNVQSLARVTSFRYVAEEAWIEVAPFLEEVPVDPAALAELRRRALANPVYARNLVSADGRAAALNLTFREMSDREFIDAGLDAQISELLADEAGAERRFYVSGRPHIKSRMYHTMTRDLLVLIPVAIAVVAAVLAVVSGSIRGVLLPLCTVTVAVVWTFAAIALLERPLTILTVLLAPTLVAVGSVYGVHVVNRYEGEAAETASPREAALATARHMVLPVLIAGLTTAVGYAALLVTDVPAVFEIGAFSVLGVASITLVSLTGLPAMLSLLPLRPRHAARTRVAARLRGALEALLRRVAGGVQRRSGAVLLAWLVAAAVAVAAIPRIVIDTDYLSFFDADSAVRLEFDAVNRLVSGAVPLFVMLEGKPGEFREPALLRRVEALQREIDALPGVSRTLSFLDTLRVLNRAVEADDPAAERIPDSRAGVTELLFMFPKDELGRFATVDQAAANLVVRTGEVGSAAVRRLVDGIRARLAESGLPEDLRAEVTGNAVLLNRAADGVARRQPLTVGLAAITIFALLAVGLGSVRLGLVAMIPNVVPVLIFFGALGLGAAPLSLPTSLIGSVALGIAIDATAHYLVRYRAERQAGASPEEAVSRTGVEVGRPVTIAASMLALGFLSVAASEFATLRQFGVLTAFTMVVCCAADLLLLPALLLRWRL